MGLVGRTADVGGALVRRVLATLTPRLVWSRMVISLYVFDFLTVWARGRSLHERRQRERAQWEPEDSYRMFFKDGNEAESKDQDHEEARIASLYQSSLGHSALEDHTRCRTPKRRSPACTPVNRARIPLPTPGASLQHDALP
jgi:hypothetical protein